MKTKTSKENQVTYEDGRTFSIGDRVKVAGLGHDFEDLAGEVVGFSRCRGAVTVLVRIDRPALIRSNERWPIKSGHFDRVLDHGAFGGELVQGI